MIEFLSLDIKNAPVTKPTEVTYSKIQKLRKDTTNHRGIGEGYDNVRERSDNSSLDITKHVSYASIPTSEVGPNSYAL